MNGWINLYKPVNISSFDAIRYLKSFSKCVGHAGTLDPFASGVLPVALGKATKIIEYVVSGEKEYVFTVQFGIATDSYDITGRIIENSKNRVSEKDIIEACQSFIGNITQYPPRYSAIKINGIRAYKLARKNIDFSVPARVVAIKSLSLEEFNEYEQSARFKVICSKGTYIRSLAIDLAKSLNTICVVVELIRTCVGVFRVEDTVTHGLVDKVLPVDFPISTSIKKVEVGFDIANSIRYGRSIALDIEDDYDVVAVMCCGELVSIGSCVNKVFKIKKVI